MVGEPDRGEEHLPISGQQQEEFLKLAAEAAIKGNPKGVIDGLFRSYALDGLVRKLRGKWRSLSHDEIDFIVAEAVSEVFYKIKEGERVRNLMGLLWKISNNKADDRYESRLPLNDIGPEEIEQVGTYKKTRDEEIEEEKREEMRRTKALSLARSLIPRLGQHNVQAVMGYLLDAIEAGRGDVPHQEIAEALGLSCDTVRQSVSRGFKRLGRIAKEEGLAVEGLEIDGIEDHDKDVERDED